MGNISVDNLNLSDEVKVNIRTWLSFGSDVEEEIKKLITEGDIKDLEDRFYRKLEFGTGGMRGKMAIGTNRMNKYTVMFATQGLANYVKKVKPNSKLSCFIGYDTRKNSYDFAIESAKVLIANGIETYILKIPMPTPFSSFGIRYYKTDFGIIITASHNPPEYNGYKVYWDDGAQVVSPHDKGIIDEVYKVDDISKVKTISNEELMNSSRIHCVLEELKEAYLRVMKVNLSEIYDVDDTSFRNNVKIVYTPLHGTSINLTPDALRYIGFENIHLVEEETTTDGTFSAVPSPNPEDDKSFKGSINLSKKVNADVLLASDPDADRVRAGINVNGEITLFSGNQIASMMLNWILSNLLRKGRIPEDGFVVTTIVTTDLIQKIAQNFGVETFLTLTGFKYIGEKIREFEGKKKFIFGCEESIGYLYGTDVRDKDSVISSCIISLMVENLKKRGMTLKDYLYEIYKMYGVHIEKLESIELEGIEGLKRMGEIVNKLRNDKLPIFNNLKPLSRIDLKNRTIEDLVTGKVGEYKTDLPKSDVIIINLENDNKFIVRPSGTEPKLKIYFFSKFDNNVARIGEYQNEANKFIESVKSYILS
jgi:phosphomannomutase